MAATHFYCCSVKLVLFLGHFSCSWCEEVLEKPKHKFKYCLKDTRASPKSTTLFFFLPRDTAAASGHRTPHIKVGGLAVWKRPWQSPPSLLAASRSVPVLIRSAFCLYFYHNIVQKYMLGCAFCNAEVIAPWTWSTEIWRAWWGYNPPSLRRCNDLYSFSKPGV